MRALWRVSLWGMAAAGAVALVVLAGQSETGSRRVMTAWSHIKSPVNLARSVATPPASPGRSDDSGAETRRLAEQVRMLNSDRERLAARLAALERSLEDVTGSISRRAPVMSPAPVQPQAGPAAADPPAAPSNSPKSQQVPQAGWAASLGQPGLPAEYPDWPLPQESTAPAAEDDKGAVTAPNPAAPAVARTEFGVDIGGGATISALRALWLSIRSSQPKLLEGLRPVVMVRDGSGGAAELRLIAGPLPNAGSAARLCSALSSTGLTCQPAVFDGQRLALR